MSADYVAYRDREWFYVTDRDGKIIEQIGSPLIDSAAETMVALITEERYGEVRSAIEAYTNMLVESEAVRRTQRLDALQLHIAVTPNDTDITTAPISDRPKEYPPLNAAKKRLEGIIDSIFEKSPPPPS